MLDYSRYKLGKRPAKHKAKTLKLARYIIPGVLPKAPVARDWLSAVRTAWGMYDNDTMGDCVVAGVAHMIMWWSANQGNLIVPEPEEVIALYKKLSPNDDGLVILDFLDYWRKNPIAGQAIGAYAAVNYRDPVELTLAMDLFGGIASGVALPVAAQNQSVWTPTSGWDAAPGTWGGHFLPWGAYQPGLKTCITWGQEKEATDGWVSTYMDEAYALIAPWWLAGGKTPEGIDTDTLAKDLSLVTGPHAPAGNQPES